MQVLKFHSSFIQFIVFRDRLENTPYKIHNKAPYNDFGENRWNSLKFKTRLQQEIFIIHRIYNVSIKLTGKQRHYYVYTRNTSPYSSKCLIALDILFLSTTWFIYIFKLHWRCNLINCKHACRYFWSITFFSLLSSISK